MMIVFGLLGPKIDAQVDAGALQQQLQKELPIPSPLPLPELQKPEEKKETAKPKAGEIQFEVKQFVLEGVKILPEKDVQAVLKPYTNTPVTFDDLQKACDAIVELYRRAGYTVQAILPPQKIADGVVKILVTEAKLGKVIVETPDGPVRFSTPRAAEYITYANQPGKPLNTKDLESALIILNEVPGVVVKSTLEQGDQDGETNVRLLMTPPKQNWTARGELNNYGSRTTGANQGVVGFNYLNPTGIGDSVGFNGIVAEGSQYVQGNYSAPVHPSGLRFGVSATYLNYKNVSNYATNGSTNYTTYANTTGQDNWGSRLTTAPALGYVPPVVIPPPLTPPVNRVVATPPPIEQLARDMLGSSNNFLNQPQTARVLVAMQTQPDGARSGDKPLTLGTLVPIGNRTELAPPTAEMVNVVVQVVMNGNPINFATTVPTEGFAVKLPETLMLNYLNVKQQLATDGLPNTLQVAAVQPDGNPLPSWLKFDPETQTFKADRIPEGTPDTPVKLQIKHGGRVVEEVEFLIDVK
jgi:hypothetical protein